MSSSFIRILVVFFSISFGGIAQAYDSFFPEAKETLEGGKAWVTTSFKAGETMSRTVFRAWYPYPPAAVWEVLIDTNEYKSVHPDYSDSRTLDHHQFEMVEKMRPTAVNDFYEIVGGEEFPSQYNRIRGGKWTSYVFQRFNFPWPLKDRWNVMKVKNDESNRQEGRYRYEYKTVAGNFKELKGYWELLQIRGKPGWTEWRGDYRADPGIQVPHFLAKTLYRSSLRGSVDDNIKVLEKRGAKKAP